MFNTLNYREAASNVRNHQFPVVSQQSVMAPRSAIDPMFDMNDVPSLSAVLHTVEQTEIGGQPKFTPSTCHYLARIIASRAYAKRLTELCHLVVLAAACDRQRRYEKFFWACGPAIPSAFKAYFQQVDRTSATRAQVIAISSDAVELRYNDGNHAIAFGRMPLLSALAEFLLTALGYVWVNAALEPLLQDEINRRKVELAANALSRRVHGYLAERLVGAQKLRQFHLMTEFLGHRNAGGPAPESIDDGAILDFWVERSGTVGADDWGFRTYRSVFKSFTKLHAALTEARERHELDHPRSLGSESEAGEIDPERICESLETVENVLDPLKFLAEFPVARIRYFNRREAEELKWLLSPDRLKEFLVLSVLRNSVFGEVQSRLANTRRADPVHGTLRERIEGAVPEDYLTGIARFRSLCDHIERILLASLHVLIRNRKAEAFVLITALAPAMDFTRLKEPLTEGSGRDKKMVALPGASPIERFVLALDRQPESLGAEFAQLAAAARMAYRGINRKGFRDSDLDSDWAGAAFAATAETLIGIRNAADRIVTALERAPVDWRSQFEDDHSVFSCQFQFIYGERNGQAAE